MDRRSAIATARSTAQHTARSLGRLSGRIALRVGREVSSRVAERRAGRTATVSPPSAQPVAPPEPREGGVPAAKTPRGPNPGDVARAVQRNDAGLTRRNPDTARRPRLRRGGPGAKLPARAGRGIVGI